MSEPPCPPRFHTRAALRADIERIGVQAGDIVMVHAAMRRVGPLLNGPDALIGALRDAVGPDGTVMVYTDWDAVHDQLVDDEGRVPEAWRDQVPPYDPATSRAVRDNGVIAEFLRTTPGARRSGNPGASVAAIGARAEWITADHPIDYGYGEGSPFAKLVAAAGMVLMIGAPLDTMTLLHHAEHLANVADKRVRRIETPFARSEGVRWQTIEEYDTADPIVAGLDDDYFGAIVRDYLATGHGQRGTIGDAESVLVDAAGVCGFAVRWIEAAVAGLDRPHPSSSPKGEWGS